MIVSELLVFSSGLVYCILCAFSLALNFRSLVNQTFALLCAFFFIWSVGVFGRLVFPEPGFWERLNYVGALWYAFAGFWFCAAVSGEFRKLNRLGSYLFLCPPFIAVTIANVGWNLVAGGFPFGFWHLAHHILANAVNFVGLAIILNSSRSVRYSRERHRSRVIVVATLIGIALAVIVDFAIGQTGLKSQSIVVILPWTVAIFFALTLTGGFGFTRDADITALFDGVAGALCIIDVDLRQVRLNLQAQKALGIENVSTHRIDGLFRNFEENRKVLADLLRKGSGTAEIIFIPRGAQGAFNSQRARVELVLGQRKEALAFVCNFESKDSDSSATDLADSYGLTAREAEIAKLLLNGVSQKEISGALHIELCTIKSHCRNIYAKLGVKNRTELFGIFAPEIRRA